GAERVAAAAETLGDEAALHQRGEQVVAGRDVEASAARQPRQGRLAAELRDGLEQRQRAVDRLDAGAVLVAPSGILGAGPRAFPLHNDIGVRHRPTLSLGPGRYRLYVLEQEREKRAAGMLVKEFFEIARVDFRMRKYDMVHVVGPVTPAAERPAPTGARAPDRAGRTDSPAPGCSRRREPARA